MTTQKYGTLLHPEIKIYRQYFREMVKLHGIYVLYRAPKDGKEYTVPTKLLCRQAKLANINYKKTK